MKPFSLPTPTSSPIPQPRELMHYRISYSPSLVQKNSLSKYISPLSIITTTQFALLQDQEKLLEPLQFLPPTKTRETDSAIRLTLIETLLLLCHTRWGRDYLRSHGVYEIIRVADENEQVKNVLDLFSSLPHAFTCLLRFQTISND